ncbi:MAG TPA: hypothetical protein VG297_18810 [Bryobacteraceae bacterium]|nr:hypothetical protein [Bryobacteraceae bacterium]
MRPLDHVRLEVRTDGPKELYASPGDRHFSPDPPISWAGSGTLGDGFFGSYLRTVFLSGNTSYFWKGDENIGGHQLARWEYLVPLISSGQTFHLVSGSGQVSLRGSFWADPATFDVIRLAISAGDIPPTLPIANADWSIDYGPVVAGSGAPVLLPQSADFRMTWLSGEAAHDTFAFTQCRSFTAESSIRFDAPDSADEPARFGVAAVDDTLRPLPSGLQIPVRLISRVSSDTAVGSLIEGVISSAVRAKKDLAIPAGSPVKGRLRRLEHYSEPVPYFIVGIEYTEVATQGIRYRFDAGLLRIDSAGAEPSLSVSQTFGGAGLPGVEQKTATVETVTFSELPGVATFFIRGDRLNLPPNLLTTWVSGQRPRKIRE